MDGFIALIRGVYNYLNIPISVWGYTFTFWQIFILVSVISIAGVVISFFVGGGK